MNNTATKMEARPAHQTNGGERAYLSPRVDIIETKDSYLLEAEMPGVTKEGLEILLENNELTIIGRRPSEKVEAELVYRESTPRDFRRVFVLDPTIDTGKIEAKLEDGVLNLKLPKAEQLTPRRIKVND
jgi:HSP20 family protein